MKNKNSITCVVSKNIRRRKAQIARGKCQLGAAVVLLLAATCAQAVENAPDLGIYTIGEVLVTEKYIQQDIGTSYEITPKDFDLSSARTLDQALTSIPSINVRNGADGTPRLDIRGLRTRQIKLLVNGIPFNAADDGQFDPTLIPTFAIGRITLQAGASSVLYGDGGMGGVLDIQTRGGFTGFKAGAKAEYGSNNFWNTNASIGYGDGINEFFAAVGVSARDGFQLSDDFRSSIPSTRQNFQDNGERNNSDARRSNLVASFNRQVTDALNLGIFLSHVEGNFGQPPSVFDCKGKSQTCLTTGDPFASTTKYERTDNQLGTTVQVGGDYAFNNNWSGRLWFFDNLLKDRLFGYDNASYDTLVRKNSFQEDDRTEMRGVHAQLNGKAEATGTGIGLSLDRRDELFDANGISCDNASNSATQTCVMSGGRTAPSSGGTKKFNYSAIDVNRGVTVTSFAGEINQPLFYDFSLLVGVAHHVQERDDGSDKSANSAQLGLSKKLTDISTIYGTVARKVDTPTINQLYDPQSGQANLDFERADHTEVGIKNHWARSELDIAVYQSRVHNFIEMDNSTNLYVNRQLFVFQGIDVTGAIQVTDALRLRGAVGLLRARDESDNANSETLQYRPHNKFTMDADYTFLSNWILSGSYQHVGEQAYFSKDVASLYHNLSSYDLVSAQLRYKLPREYGSVYVGANNLLDKNYSTSYGFPQAGRFTYIGMQLDW